MKTKKISVSLNRKIVEYILKAENKSLIDYVKEVLPHFISCMESLDQLDLFSNRIKKEEILKNEVKRFVCKHFLPDGELKQFLKSIRERQYLNPHFAMRERKEQFKNEFLSFIEREYDLKYCSRNDLQKFFNCLSELRLFNNTTSKFKTSTMNLPEDLYEKVRVFFDQESSSRIFHTISSLLRTMNLMFLLNKRSKEIPNLREKVIIKGILDKLRKEEKDKISEEKYIRKLVKKTLLEK